MAFLDLEYQNIFTRVQVRGPAYLGVAISHEPVGREGKTGFSHVFGQIATRR
jgi:photosynthetic reaction center M subunit